LNTEKVLDGRRPQLRWNNNIRAGLLTAPEYKRMEETRKGLGYLEANY
jgi:hypothetical protein